MADAELKANEARYRYASMASRDAIWEHDCKTNVKFWGELGDTLFGWQADATHPRPAEWWIEKVHPEDRARIASLWACGLARLDCDRLRAEYRFRKADGAYAYVDDRCHILRDATGAAVRLIGAMQDITDRKHDEIVRARLQQQLNQSQEMAHLGSWEHDHGEDRMLWSDETCRIVGMDREQFDESYAGFLSAVHPEDRSRVEAEYARSLADPGYLYELDHRLIRPDTGEVRIVHVKCTHERDADGHVVRSYGFVQDVTEAIKRNTLFRQSQKLEGLGRLTAGIAHEINNPVGYLMNNFAALQTDVELFRDLILDYRALRAKVAGDPALAHDIAALEARERETKLEFILSDLDALFLDSREGFERIMNIVGGMRSLAREDRNNVRESFDLNSAVRSVLIITRNEYQYHCDVTVDYGENLPAVSCLPGKISQVILNLVVNAAHAIAEQARGDKGLISIRTFAAGLTVCLEVRDDGPGIPEAIRDLLFEPFVTTKPLGKGLGLGLSIAYDIVVTQHGGSLTVDSRDGAGATFRVCLPADAHAGNDGGRI